MIALSFMFCCLFLYLMVQVNDGILESFSSTAYLVGRKWVFTAALLGIGGLMLPAMLAKCDGWTKVFAVLMIAGLAVVAFTPNYKTKDGLQHNIAGIACCVFSQVAVALNAPMMLFLWFPCLIYLVLHRDRNYTFWVEVTCLTITYAFGFS